jgi:hypothetical protein
MPISTVFDEEHYLTSSLKVFKEWMSDFILDCNISDETPTLSEDYPISKIVIHFQLLPGYDKSVGFGRNIGNGKKGKIFQPEWMINYITTQDIGGINKVRELSEILKTNILKNGYLLSESGLVLPTCDGLREFPKSSSSIYYGGRQMVTYRVLVTY